MKLIGSLIFAATLSSPSLGQSQIEYPDAIEIRARDVGRQLRCVVCQNQSIEESDAALAADMRRLVRDRLLAGNSEDDIISLMRDRYGDYVLLMPPVQGNTIVLWAGPAAMIFLFLLWWVVSVRAKPVQPSVSTLSDHDAAKLAALRNADL
ncbi:cytochrome c-type biogenesis protein CcmH [Algimonas arctica]|uniref:Cytochrome c-type biogenesis protein n=1 Tax=Algimonas arctica TaxID=1479486 RepID=A0A8J3G3D9_9PROT|nr:cytochrome c-type biogenesis protein [Algimonas arctica]GHB04565.1 cytochrome c-type biogenesis protein CcmH [Algimonas arctica]